MSGLFFIDNGRFNFRADLFADQFKNLFKLVNDQKFRSRDCFLGGKKVPFFSEAEEIENPCKTFPISVQSNISLWAKTRGAGGRINLHEQSYQMNKKLFHFVDK